MKDTLRTYYWLTKPGIVYGNALSSVAGFLLASSLRGEFNIRRFVAMLIGSSLVIACGCVINNYIDRHIDAKMARTKQRALVTGEVSPRNAFMYAAVLGLCGFGVLIAYTNWLTVLVGLVGLFFYVVMYGIWKRKAPFGTLVGSVSGATPILAGYTAAAGKLDGAAIIIFVAMMLWQMPHFYAIALYRLKDYQKAGLPVLPVRHGSKRTKREMLGFILAFTLVACALTVFNYTGTVYLGVMAALGFYWLLEARDGFKAKDDAAWGKHMFRWSLVVLLVWLVAVSIGALLP